MNIYHRFINLPFDIPKPKQFENGIESFITYWPQSVNLYVYAEDCDVQVDAPNVVVYNLLERSKDLVEFKDRHRNNPVANGEVMKETGIPFKDNHFKWDAVRFSHKVFSVIDACKTIDSEWVIWLDADCVTFDYVTESFLDRMCNNSALACYLGRRPKYHSECGWVAYNRRHSQILQFIEDWRELYTSDSLFDLREFHDSFVFDVLRKDYQHNKGVYFHNISPPEGHGKGPGHPFIASELGRYIDHLKGSRRKEMGKSKWRGDETSYGFHPDVDYWRD